MSVLGAWCLVLGRAWCAVPTWCPAVRHRRSVPFPDLAGVGDRRPRTPRPGKRTCAHTLPQPHRLVVASRRHPLRGMKRLERLGTSTNAWPEVDANGAGSPARTPARWGASRSGRFPASPCARPCLRERRSPTPASSSLSTTKDDARRTTKHQARRTRH